MATKAQLGVAPEMTPDMRQFIDAVSRVRAILDGKFVIGRTAAEEVQTAIRLLPAARLWLIQNGWRASELAMLREILDSHPDLGYFDTTPPAVEVCQAMAALEVAQDEAVRLLGGK